MQKLWNWLMRTNAKALFWISAVALAMMCVWCGVVEVSALSAKSNPDSALKHTEVQIPPYEGLGILDYIEEQSDSRRIALPVNFFRPSFDTMMSNLVHSILNDPEIEIPDENNASEADTVTILPLNNANIQTGFDRHQTNRTSREIHYAGVFKRSDGIVSAYVTDKTSGKSKFCSDGDEVFGLKVVYTSTDLIKLRKSDGTNIDILRGSSAIIHPNEVSEKSLPRKTTSLEQRSNGRRRRAPTEAEIAAIAKTNPELAHRLRSAIKARQEQQ